mmetsp:Transcript_43571/g.138739  ORF Transcript_43571/g.138739 Transcript_43571/m.138739 type:complete len:204 (-) Transcript_43571:49-660(-)
METPFGLQQAIVLSVTAMIPTMGNSPAQPKPVFTARSAVSFKVTDGLNAILVEVSDPAAWRLRLRLGHHAHNIFRDDRRGCLVSGGDRPGMHSQVQPKPCALQFWADFENGRDPVDRMTCIQEVGRFNRPREAKENFVAPGDAVAVAGTLMRVGPERRIVSDDRAAITNLASESKALSSCPMMTFDCGTPDVAPIRPPRVPHG